MVEAVKSLVEGYRNKTISEEDIKIIDECFKKNIFRNGQISILFPNHYKAFEILFHETDLSISDLAEIRKSGNKGRNA